VLWTLGALAEALVEPVGSDISVTVEYEEECSELKSSTKERVFSLPPAESAFARLFLCLKPTDLSTLWPEL
jgi:hypothetical protein